MRSLMLRYSLFLVLLFVTLLVCGQRPAEGPYHLSLKRELLFGTAALGSVGAGYAIEQGIDEVPLSSLMLPRVSAFDRGALDNSSGGARAMSDILAYGSVVTPLALILAQENLGQVATVTLLYAETMLLNQGVSSVIKSSLRRPRPYLYSEASIIATTATAEAYDRTSFPSAHTSNTAAATFFFGRVFADCYPDSRLKPYVWTLAAVVPAATGYFRVQAGEHFPTDVLAGYALGAAIGYAVPALHRRPVRARGVAIAPAGSGFYLSYRF